MRFVPLFAALLPLAAIAAPAPVDVDDPALLTTPVDADGTWRPVLPMDPLELVPGEIELLLEDLATRAPDHALGIDPLVVGPDGLTRLEDLLPVAPPVPDKEPAHRGRPVDHPGKVDGALSGKAVYLSQCHGFIWYESIDRFSTQRGNLFDTVEDFHNPEGMNQFLSVYLENAGAAVFTAKERDHNPTEVIVDNGDAGTEEVGDGFDNGGRGWATRESWAIRETPFSSGSTRTMPADGGGTYRWTVDVPRADTYAIYVSWDSDSAHATDAHYRITHPGGTIDRWYDQTVHGSTWQYTERLWLEAGESLTIELLADSSESGKLLSIDAVRIGGGEGRISRFGELTGRPRWEEGAILHTQLNGAPATVYDPYNDRVNGSDPPARSRWADWEHPAGEDAVYLSWHSNATANGTARGTVTYIYEGSAGAAYAGSSILAGAVQDEMVDAFQTLWEPGWQDRGVKTAAFAEVNPSHNNEMPAALVELAFHDNETDNAYLKHPRFRLDAARAMYRGIVRTFAERNGTTAAFLPEPPVALAVEHEGGELVLTWQDGAIGAPYGDAPTEWIVQTSADGRAWTEGFAVSGRRTVLDVDPGELVFARVIATNDGGMSFASEVVGGRRSPDGEPAVLVVDAFDRFETGQLEWVDVPWTVGRVRRLDSDRVNPHDIIVSHGVAIDAARWPFDAISDERLGDLDLSRYPVIVWATGEESTVDETFSTAQQDLLRAYRDQGGALWVSGAEILWDLDERGSAADQAFAGEVLGATLASDDAGTESASGTGLLDGLDLSFPADQGPYPVEWPDVLASSRTPIATYATGDLAGVLGERVALFGFPFESIADADARDEVAIRLLAALAPDYEPPDDPVDTGDPGETDTDDPIAGGPERERIPSRGCGCASADRAPWLGLLALPLLVLARRRTRRP